jgi:hypothetical protein
MRGIYTCVVFYLIVDKFDYRIYIILASKNEIELLPCVTLPDAGM